MPPETRMSNVVGTPPESEGRALVLSLWSIGATMQNISFEYFLTLSTNCKLYKGEIPCFFFVDRDFLVCRGDKRA
ncbi:hypothetical protein TthWC1_1058a [Thermoanaerobacter thermohydrosulfuricus WC1]|uniref:Uncharacterized protein n=1 Tax=Thermoanaerobacter thermohydrosulfuricus WC1 TaxID=1198630 RepID=M8CYK8_THETY|nr:hypothetical protein TthWC1_1058a [Thermoanaerobacter thermohydrosulfuricus WC1]